MSRQGTRARTGLKLPFALEKELGLEGTLQPRTGGGRRWHGLVQSRKEQRKAQRQEKRQNIKGPVVRRGPPITRQGLSDGGDSDEDGDEPFFAPAVSKRGSVKQKTKKEEPKKPKSILKRHRDTSPSLSESSLPSRARSSSPGLVLDANSQAFKERAAQDDAEIAVLERKLGLKKKKTSKSFADDGLDDLLELLDGEDRGVKRKGEGEAWLDRKRRKADTEDDESAEEDFGSDDDGDDDKLDGELGESDDSLDEQLEGGFEEEQSDEDLSQGSEDSFEGFDSDKDIPDVQPPKVRENPYVPPVAQAPTGKYIPPSLRKVQNSEGPSLERLKKQLQGHLNKLSEANLVSILGEIEKLYQSNPRQDITSVLIDLLLTLFCNRSTLQNTFVILHAAYATAVYKVIGVDFGAELISQLVERLDHYRSDSSTGKEALNLISLLCHLFTFHLISSTIIFDYVRLLLERLSENNTELLLRVVRDCGHQLRQDDPSSLKDIVQIMQKEAARMNSAGEQMSVRTKFMIETITDLKNNKMKTGANNAGLASEHITLMRKVLGSLNNTRTVRASEPLRITRDDIKNSDKKGKWWLVGASWKGHEPAAAAPAEGHINTSMAMTSIGLDDDDDESVDLLALSRHYGMNTDIRRSIFIALLSAVDYQDAHLRLLKLRLKHNQELEIPKVLLRCSAGEKPYNHYYTLVARKLCLEKKMRKAFQFALWDFFRRMGENPKGDDDEEEDAGEGDQEVEMTEIANLARLYAYLILDGAETLGVLKVLELAYIKERTAMFVELLLIIIMTEAKDKPAALAKVFDRAAETPQIIKRLQFFIQKNVRASDLVGKKDRDVVKRGCQTALETLRKLEMINEETDT
ncbi:hypothetical protein AYL99_07823 [Fonsecaea erecta]|uniref:MI domain-containing protein n=1 Tax=Fonsecaea erecta TaxID=1367422 RepID=A0A178ZHR5_9EURO|nr:hypothetical protein AYL99_07823 [Fonsecaea erecta]OAP58733.1 hypothetical protein AYL99_07823 [Fonsecaea erecta]